MLSSRQLMLSRAIKFLIIVPMRQCYGSNPLWRGSGFVSGSLFSLDADLDPSPAPHQSDANLRLLVYRPFELPFWASIPTVSVHGLHSSIACIAPKFRLWCGSGSGFPNDTDSCRFGSATLLYGMIWCLQCIICCPWLSLFHKKNTFVPSIMLFNTRVRAVFACCKRSAGSAVNK